MLNEREHLKNLILQYLSDFNDILYLDKQDRESFKAHVTKNKEEQFIIFDKNYSIEIIFDKIYLNRFLQDKPSTYNLSNIIGSIIHVKKFDFKISNEPIKNKGTYIYSVKLIIVDFDIFPSNSRISIKPPKSINNDIDIHFKIAEYFHKINIAKIELIVKNDNIINNLLKIPFYSHNFHYKFDDFELDFPNPINTQPISIKESNENVFIYELSSNESELKSKQYKKICVTKQLEYFNKAEEIEKLKRKEELIIKQEKPTQSKTVEKAKKKFKF